MAIKKYSYKKQKDIKISSHISVKEMASKRYNTLYSDIVKVDLVLIDMVEELIDKLNATKVIITSGYRTKDHDKVVGGNGKGSHTTGQAIDCCFYDKFNNVISAKYVCCVAQDLGFKGIANISKGYQYVHLDNKNRIYKGDEIYSTNTVTKDFYKYFGINKITMYNKLGIEQYYPMYRGKSNKVDTVLKSIGVDKEFYGSYSKRKYIAKVNGINYYIGSAEQNLKIISLAKQGKLKR